MSALPRHTSETCSDRLESWKEIAAYLNRGARTVQRWEKTENLPVHRHMHERQGTVYAFRSELDDWWASRRASLEAVEQPETRPAPARIVRRPWVRVASLTLAGLAAVVGGVVTWRAFTAIHPVEFRVGRSVPLTSFTGHEAWPAFSPDSGYVAFTAHNQRKDRSDIFVQALGKGEPVRLTESPGYDLAPRWSPDGKLIAFLRAEKNGTPPGIMIKPALGGTEKRIAGVARAPLPVIAWSKDPRWMVLATSTSQGAPASLHRLSVATGQIDPIADVCADCAADGSIALSPEGSQLAFLRYMPTGKRDIYVLELRDDAIARGEPKRVTFHDGLVGVPVWLPDTDEIAYPLIIDFSWTWHRVRASGGRPRVLEGFADIRPAMVFSPDGSQVAYSEHTEDLNIRRGSLTDTGEADLIASTRIDTNPHISPDGREIVFASNRRGNVDIWKTNADGGSAVQLASFPGKSSGTPRWSPDGREIAFDVTENNNADLWVMSSDGARLRQITFEPSRDFVPSWSRDGKSIYFGSDRSGDHQIWKVHAAGGAALQITRNGGYAAWEAPDGRSLYFTKFTGKGDDGVYGLFRMPLFDGGAEERVIDGYVDWSRTAVTPAGIYYITQDHPDDGHWLCLFDPAARITRRIRKLDRASSLGFSVSPDGRWFIYSAAERPGSDLLLAEVHH